MYVLHILILVTKLGCACHDDSIIVLVMAEVSVQERDMHYGNHELPFSEDEWQNFHCWLHCICTVTFDLEVGQALEVVYPSHAKLSEKEKTNLCYLAFPDSNSGCMGDTVFHFRMRARCGSSNMPDWYRVYNEKCPLALQADPAYYFGYVYFRQVKNRNVPRGYLQKSIVMISYLPLVALLSHIVQIIAPEYFESGELSIEAACQSINKWPLPEPGRVLTLPLLGSVFQVRIASRHDNPNTSPVHGSKLDESLIPSTFLKSAYELDLYEYFLPIVMHMQLLWELVLLGEPLLVIAPLPSASSTMVQALVSLIAPLNYCQDYRPFFTIHDNEFKEYTTKTQAPPRVILGVTNPFFTKTLQHWPHIIRVAETTCNSNSSSPVANQKLKKSGNLKTLDSKPGVYTRYKPFLKNDKNFLRKVLKGIQTKRPSEVQNALLRRHFLEVTQSFMIPLERYIASLLPLRRNISPFREAPKIWNFDIEDFLRTLDVSGPQLTSGLKGDWIGLYKAFFQSASFQCWLHQRQSEVNHKLRLLHLDVLNATNFTEALSSKCEVEIVDLLLNLKQALRFAEQNSSVHSEIRSKLRQQYQTVLKSLNPDLQQVLLSSESCVDNTVQVQS